MPWFKNLFLQLKYKTITQSDHIILYEILYEIKTKKNWKIFVIDFWRRLIITFALYKNIIFYTYKQIYNEMRIIWSNDVFKNRLEALTKSEMELNRIEKS